MPRPHMLFATLLFAASSGAAQGQVDPPNAPADCRLRVTAVPTGWFIQNYDPFGAGSPEATFSVSFVNDGSSDCRFYPFFQIDQPPFGLTASTGKPVNYVILDITSGVDVTPRAGRTQSILSKPGFFLSPNETKTVTYKFAAEPNDINASGTFAQNVTLEAQGEAFAVYGAARIPLALNVLPSARIGLAGAYTLDKGRAMVDLGELREGPASVPLNLRVQSIGTYEISVSSGNAGRLRLGSTDWTVPYSITVGGRPVNLSASDTVAGQTRGIHAREHLPIEFFIGDVSKRRSGVYSDIISISVTAR